MNAGHFVLFMLGLVTIVPLAFVPFGIHVAFDDADKLRRFLTDLLRDFRHADRIHQVDNG